MKSYTDIDQSRKLAEILPLNSADMHYNNVDTKGTNYTRAHRAELIDYNTACEILSSLVNFPFLEVIPCWSLAALIDVLPPIHSLKPILDLEENSIQYSGIDIYVKGDNLVDTCYEVILKLNKLKKL